MAGKRGEKQDFYLIKTTRVSVLSASILASSRRHSRSLLNSNDSALKVRGGIWKFNSGDESLSQLAELAR